MIAIDAWGPSPSAVPRVIRWLVALFAILASWALIAQAAFAATPEVSIQNGGERYFSPNGDGQEDTASVMYCMAEPANVTVTITDSSDSIVRTLDDDVSHPGGCGYNTTDVANWDGENGSGTVLPDGLYTMRIHAVDSSGEVSEATTQLGIETRTPGTLTAPVPGDSLSDQASWMFTLTPGVPVSRAVAYCGLGGGYSESFTPEPNGTFAGTVETTQCANGENNIVGYVEWTDPLGAAHGWSFTPVPVTIKNAPVVSVSSGGQRYFTPNGDGQEDTVTVYYCLSQPADVTTTITNSKGTVVKTIEPEKETAAYCSYDSNPVTWDGTNESGTTVPTGSYTMHIHAVDPYDQTGETTTELGIETETPGTLTAPSLGSSLSGPANWVFTPTAGFSVSRVYIYCSSGGGYSESFTPEPNGTFAGTVETTQCANGENNIVGYVEWTDPLGAAHGWSFTPVPVTIKNTPQLSLSTYYGGERYFSPNGDGQEDAATIYYCLSENANITATVTNAKGALVRTVESETPTNPSACNYYNDSVTWNGKDDSGEVVPDGVYTLHIHALDEYGQTNEIATRLGVETQTPGVLTAPATGETMAGLAHFAFTPTAGVSVDEVELSFDTGGSTTIYNASPDGEWHTSMYTGTLGSGPANLSITVVYTDPFGVVHYWSGPVTPVTIDVTSLPLAFTADPKSGLAPFSTTLDIETSDPDARTVHYALSFGDGTSAEGEASPPYTAIEIAHTYEQPGAYQAIATVTNGAGGASNAAIDIDATAPVNTPPIAELKLDKISGPSPLTIGASISGTDPQEHPLTYTLEFGDGTAPATGSLPHEAIDHTYAKSGTYTMHLAVSDGKLTTTTTETVHVSLGPPEESSPPEITGIAEEDQTLAEVHGSWTNEPTEYKYRWLRCEPEGGSCKPISGATKQTYPLTSSDVGDTLEVEEIAKNATASGSPVISQPTDVVLVNHAPTTTLEGGPSGPTNHAGPFTFSADEPATFECSVDSEPFTACMSPVNLEGRPDGPHTFHVRAVGVFGEVEAPAVSREFILDTVPPTVTITRAPSQPIHTGSLGFAYESSEAGTLECAFDSTPYVPCEAWHFEAEEFSAGEHRFKVQAVDLAGNVSAPAEATFTIINSPPTAGLQVSPEAGPAALTVTATIEGSDPDGDGLHYELQFGDGSQESGVLPAKPIEHTYGEPGVYEMRLDVTDGHEHTVVTRSVTVTLDEPLKAEAGEDQTVVVGEPVTLDGEDSRPLRGITSYQWDFGDGQSSDGASVEHTYNAPGEYQATLTVQAPGAHDSSTTTIHVLPKPGGEGYVETVQFSGTPLEGAEVLVILGDGTRIHGTTGSDGKAHLYGLPDGEYEAYVYKPGYLPAATHATANGGEGAGSVELKAGEVATAQVTSHMMNLNEIEAAGINPSDPANRHVYEFAVHINVVPFSGGGGSSGGVGSVGGYIGADGFIGGVGSPCSGSLCIWHAAGATIYTTVTYVPGLEAPLLSSLVIPFKASFLKEFFDVSMIVNNLAPAPFTLKGGHATIGLPGGMSLAPTANQQTITESLPDISGEGSATAHWILRGDNEGEYNLSSTYAASLEPFGRTINLSAATTTPVHVWGASALHLTVDTDQQVKDGYPFHVKVGLTDVADVPVYDPEIELLKTGRHGYIEQPRQQEDYGTREIAPGQTFWSGEFILVPEASGEVDLNHSFIQKIGGDIELSSTLTTHERVPSLASTPQVKGHRRNDHTITLEWEPVAGATGFEIHKTPIRETDFPSEPDRNVILLGETKAVITDAPEQPESYFAVSSIINGKPTMVHPLISSDAVTPGEYPRIQVTDQTPCESTQATAHVVLEDKDFPLTDWRRSVGGGSTTTEPLSGERFEGYISGVRQRGTLLPYKMTVSTTEPDSAKAAPGSSGPSATADGQLGECHAVGLGDSFSSGEGNPPFEPGTAFDEYGQAGESKCHRSEAAYLPRLTSNHPDITKEAFVACSGAVIEDIDHENTDKAGNPGVGPQIDAITGSTNLVTLSIGGNDVGFSDILKGCIKQHFVTLGLVPCFVKYGHEVSQKLNGLPSKLMAAYKAIRNRLTREGQPNARVIVMGYPYIFPLLAVNQPLNTCALLNPADILWMHQTITQANEVIERAAHLAGFEFVDPNAHNRFLFHSVCEPDGYFNGVHVFNAVESFHPNGLGQSAMEEALAEQLGEATGSSFIIKLGQTLDHVINVIGHDPLLTLEVTWPGSDVSASLVKPNGEVIDPAHLPPGAEHERGATFETYSIPDAEPGEWIVRTEGVEIAPGGEPVGLQVTQNEQPPLPPLAVYTASPESGSVPQKVEFNGSPSIDPEDEALSYEWNFGDGTTGTGETTTHVYTAPGTYEPILTVRDTAGLTNAYRDSAIAVTTPEGEGETHKTEEHRVEELKSETTEPGLGESDGTGALNGTGAQNSPIGSTQTSGTSHRTSGVAGFKDSAGGPLMISGAIRDKTGVVTVPLHCLATSGACQPATVELIVEETVRDGRITGVTAGSKPKTTKRVVILGHLAVVVQAGQSKVIEIPLNGAAKKLLAARTRLRTQLQIVSLGHVSASRDLTLTASRPKRRRT